MNYNIVSFFQKLGLSSAIANGGASGLNQSPGKSAPVSVTFTWAFSGELVKLFANGKKVFARKLTTDWTDGVAGGALVQFTNSKGSLTVEIPKLRQKRTIEIDPNKGTLICIGVDKGGIGFDQRTHALLMD